MRTIMYEEYKKNSLRYKYYRYRSGRDQYLTEVWGDELSKEYSKKQNTVNRTIVMLSVKNYDTSKI